MLIYVIIIGLGAVSDLIVGNVINALFFSIGLIIINIISFLIWLNNNKTTIK